MKGFGAFASRDIRANEMLGEYAGEIIDAKELRKRQKRHEEQMAKQKPEPPPDMIEGMSAAAKAATVAGPAKRKRGEAALTDEQLASRLTGRHYVFDLGCGLSVDASHAGNSTRYLNHATAGSDEANVRAQVTNHFGIRCATSSVVSAASRLSCLVYLHSLLVGVRCGAACPSCLTHCPLCLRIARVCAKACGILCLPRHQGCGRALLRLWGGIQARLRHQVDLKERRQSTAHM